MYYHVNFRIMLHHLYFPCWSPVVMRLGYVHLSEPKKNWLTFRNISYQTNIVLRNKISHKYYHALVFVLVDGSFVLNKVLNAYTWQIPTRRTITTLIILQRDTISEMVKCEIHSNLVKSSSSPSKYSLCCKKLTAYIFHSDMMLLSYWS